MQCPNCQKKFEERGGLLFCESCGWHSLNAQGEIVPADAPPESAAEPVGGLPPSNAEPEPAAEPSNGGGVPLVLVLILAAVAGYHVLKRTKHNAIINDDRSGLTPDETPGVDRSLWL